MGKGEGVGAWMSSRRHSDRLIDTVQGMEANLLLQPKQTCLQRHCSDNLRCVPIQFTGWSAGMFQIFLSKYCPFIIARGKIEFGSQMGYCIYLLWPKLSLPTLCYAIAPAISVLRGVPLFPEVSSVWSVPFALVFAAKTGYSLVEDIIAGDTVKGWWNLQRMALIQRITAYFLALIETMSKLLGLSQTAFVLTAKVVDDEAEKRYKKGLIELGSSSIMMVIITTLALLNLFTLGWGRSAEQW